jgi:hypothetical protein
MMESPTFQTNNWVAWEFNLRSNVRTIKVKGDVTFPTPAYTAILNKAIPQGINPTQLILQLIISKRSGIFPQVLTTQSVFWGDEDEPSLINYNSVLIQLPDANTITIDVQKNLPQDDSENLTVTFIPPVENLNLLGSITIGNRSELGNGTVGVFGIMPNGLLFLARYEKELASGIKWVEFFTKPPFVRKYKGDLWLTLDHPRIDEITEAIKDCLVGSAVVAAIAAVVAGIVSGGGAISAAATATFKAALLLCLRTKGIEFAEDIAVNLEIRNRERD